jgi:hypothetical protein
MFVTSHSSKLDEVMLKSFIQTSVLYNVVEKVILHQPGYRGVARWFHITLEPDVYPQYCWLVNVTFYAVCFFNVYITVILNSNEPDDITSRPLLLRITTIVIPGVFWCHFCCQNFVAKRHTKVVIHSLSLRCHVSKLKQPSLYYFLTLIQGKKNPRNTVFY